MCECGNFKNPLQTVVLFLLTLVIWSCSVSWLLSSGLLDLSPSHIPETIYSPAGSIFYLSTFSTQLAWQWPKFLIVLTCQHPSFQLHIGDTFWQHFPSFLPDFCSFLPFLLLRPNSCGPVTFGLQALVELHMRLQRTRNTSWAEHWIQIGFHRKLNLQTSFCIIQYLEKRVRRWYSTVEKIYWVHFSNRAQIISRKKRRNKTK